MHGQKVFKILDFWFIATSNNVDNFNGVDLVLEYRRVVFEWEGFGLESFRKDTSLSLYIYTRIHTHTYIYIHTHTHTLV